MPFFTSPTSFRNANPAVNPPAFNIRQLAPQGQSRLPFSNYGSTPHSSHPALPHLTLLVFEAVLEVVCVSLPGYIVARMGMFDAEAQKFVANLNVMLFTPCLIFTKLASQLTAEKLTDLAIIPFIFIAQTIVSYGCAFIVSRCFRFRKRQSNFVAAMGVFGNSNSLPISLVISLSQTLEGLHWDRVPNDNDDEVAARGILYLLIFQQLGQLLRWSWGYNVLLAPQDKYDQDEEDRANLRIQRSQERYSDHPEIETIPTGSLSVDLTPATSSSSVDVLHGDVLNGDFEFESGTETPEITRQHSYSKLPSTKDPDRYEDRHPDLPPLLELPQSDQFHPRLNSGGLITSFPEVEITNDPSSLGGIKALWHTCQRSVRSAWSRVDQYVREKSGNVFESLPLPLQKCMRSTYDLLKRFLSGLWGFMNPPLWAMLTAIIVASVPTLQRLLFGQGTFLSNSATRAISQNGAVAVPLILVVLGANLARNTLPKEAVDNEGDPKEERNLIIASLVARMLLPTLVVGPLLAITAKYVPISILDDPIFVIVCFLLTGAPSALQLAQICQINNVYMGAMSKLLFQSYVIWILPSTLVLVLCALEVVEWARP